MPVFTPEIWAFIGLIFAGMLLAHIPFTETATHYAPGILITIGIFATSAV